MDSEYIFYPSAVCHHRLLNRLDSRGDTNGGPSPSIWIHRCNIHSHFIWWVLSSNILFKKISERPVTGVYCLIFGLYLQIQLKRTGQWKGVFPYAITASFILCTAYLTILIIQDQFEITVSYIQVVHYCPCVMAPNISDVQLIFEFPDSGVEWRLIRICWYLRLADRRK